MCVSPSGQGRRAGRSPRLRPVLLTDIMAPKRIQADRGFMQQCERLEAVPPSSLAAFHARSRLSDWITEGELIEQKAASRRTFAETEEAWREEGGCRCLLPALACASEESNA